MQLPEAQHTAGPWRVAEIDGEPGAVEIRAGTFPIYLGTVALLYDHNAKHADARLIAAAPAMLQRLREACVILDGFPVRSPWQDAVEKELAEILGD